MTSVGETKPLLTPADLLAAPDGGRGIELVDGVLVEKPSSELGSLVAASLSGELSNHCERGNHAWVFGASLGYHCFPDRPLTVRKPSVSVILSSRLSIEQIVHDKKEFCDIPPDLVAEVLSPSHRAYQIESKVHEYLGAGVRLVWLVYPRFHTVYIYRLNGSITRLGPDSELSGEDVLPGFSCRIADLFPTMKAPGPSA